MLFSVNYHSKWLAEADEIRCPFNQLGRIFDFVKQHPDKRYIIIFDKDDIEKLIEQVEFIRAVAQSYSIQCTSIVSCQTLISQNYNAFLKFPATDWETFQNLRELGVTDIYIDGPLGFQCKCLAAAKKDVKIRVAPTVSPNSSLSAGSKATSFFIRPEDLQLPEYQSAIDVVDFYINDQDKEDALFSIYKRGTFYYTIDTLIQGLKYHPSNVLFDEKFGATRANCAQRCKVPGYYCHYCDKYMKALEQTEHYIKISRE